MKNRNLVIPVNDLLRSFAANAEGTEYLDLYPSFVDDHGAQRRNLFNDSLHPSRDGYRLWRDRLTEFLRTG
jgi:lysophospholipase L1-like esterase